jgi:hypothetical protein
MAISGSWRNPFAARKALTPEQMAAAYQSLTSYTWQLPWGSVTTGSTGKSDGTQSSAFSAETTLWTVAAEVVKGRRYHLSATANFYSPAGASNFTLRLKVDGTTLESVEGAPTTTIGRVVSIVDYVYEPTASATVSLTATGQFTGATGVTLYDGGRWVRVTAVDVGPA